MSNSDTRDPEENFDMRCCLLSKDSESVPPHMITSVKFNVSSSMVCVAVTAITAFCCFLPYIINQPFQLGDGRITESIVSQDLRTAEVVAVSMALPLLCDVVMDINLIAWENLLPRLLMILGLLVPTLVVLLFHSHDASFYFCVYQARSVLVCGGLICYLVNLDVVRYASIGLFAIAMIMINLTMWQAFSSPSIAMDVFLQLSQIVYGLYILYFLCVYARPKSSKYLLLYVFMINFYIISNVINWGIHGFHIFQGASSSELTGYITIEIVTAVVAIAGPARMTREEGLINRVSSICA